MNLALRAGGGYIADPGQLLRDMRPSVLGLWAAHNTIDPWDGNRGDAHAALIASTLANVKRDPKKKPEPFRLDEFLLYREAQTPESVRQAQMSAKIRAVLLGASGHKAKRKD